MLSNIYSIYSNQFNLPSHSTISSNESSNSCKITIQTPTPSLAPTDANNNELVIQNTMSLSSNQEITHSKDEQPTERLLDPSIKVKVEVVEPKLETQETVESKPDINIKIKEEPLQPVKSSININNDICSQELSDCDDDEEISILSKPQTTKLKRQRTFVLDDDDESGDG